MVNFIWLFLILSGIIMGMMNNTLSEVAMSVTSAANTAVQLAIGLIGVLTFWMGLMRVAEQAGLVSWIAKKLKKIIKPLFPDVPSDHPAMGAMVMNMAANMLGLGNAATPLGVAAMQHLQALNQTKDVATNAMCTFLAINTSSVQLIPTGAMAVLLAAGSINPTIIIVPAFLATCCSTCVAVVAVKILEKTGRVE